MASSVSRENNVIAPKREPRSNDREIANQQPQRRIADFINGIDPKRTVAGLIHRPF